MRLAAQTKGGYYPAHPNAIELAASLLHPPDEGRPCTILDPCAGEGAAVDQLRESLGCPLPRTYALELDDSRANALQQKLIGARVLAPADFFACRATPGSFSFIWLNPPFDDAYGGSRVEHRFLMQSTEWLKKGGVLALVCPQDVVGEFSACRKHLVTFYENITVTPFPEQHRPYREVLVLGHKRSRPSITQTGINHSHWQAAQAPTGFKYQLPSGEGPQAFEKTEPTESELRRLIGTSPLTRHLKAGKDASLPSPPLPLGTGHIALLLASGHLNGLVQPEVKPPHVVRGTCQKRTFVSDVTEAENDDGSTTTRTTFSERIDLVIRTVDRAGRIRTLSQEEDDQA
ncbi:MAG: DUF6094 domain-containing protein [Gemmataceae bacterium]